MLPLMPTSIQTGEPAERPAPNREPNRWMSGVSAAERLPAPARRYLARAGGGREPVAHRARLCLTGRVRPGGSARMVPFRAVVTFSPPHPPAISASVRYGVLEVTATSCADGLRWHLFDTFQLNGRVAAGKHTLHGRNQIYAADPGSPAVLPAWGQRVAAAAVLFPPYLCPARGARWESVSEDAARTRFLIEQEPVELLIRVDARGFLLEATSNCTREPAGGLCVDQIRGHGRFAGYTLPTSFRAAWQSSEGRREALLFAKIVGAEFD